MELKRTQAIQAINQAVTPTSTRRRRTISYTNFVTRLQISTTWRLTLRAGRSLMIFKASSSLRLLTSSTLHSLMLRQIHNLLVEIPSTRNRCPIRNICNTLLRSSVTSWMSSKLRWKAALSTSKRNKITKTCTSQCSTDQTTCSIRLATLQTKTRSSKRMKTTTFWTWLKSNSNLTKIVENQEALNLVRSKVIQEYRLPEPTLRQEVHKHRDLLDSTLKGITVTCSVRPLKTCWIILIYWSLAMDTWLTPTTSKWKIKPTSFNKLRTSLTLNRTISLACSNKSNSTRENS